MQDAYIGFGQVRHARLRPKGHAFNYPSYFLFLPMRHLKNINTDLLKVNKFAGLSFYDCDHGDPNKSATKSALDWFEEMLEMRGINGVSGEVWLHCFPRVWGYAFKPVSFWYGFSDENELKVILVEVNNTFGQRHCYLIEAPKFGQEYTMEKVFHVSPFIETRGEYKFRFMLTKGANNNNLDGIKTVVKIEYFDEDGLLLKTSVSGALERINGKSVRKALWRYPLMTFGVILRIHFQALMLWFKGAKFNRSPAMPNDFISIK